MGRDPGSSTITGCGPKWGPDTKCLVRGCLVRGCTDSDRWLFVVVILRCTAKAAGLLGVAAAADIAADDSDWYMNLIWIEGRKNLLLTHAGTAFPIFVADIRKPDLHPLGEWLTQRIANALAHEHLPADALGPLDPEAVTVAKTISRQVLGYMNDTALAASWQIADAGGLAHRRHPAQPQPAARPAQLQRPLRHTTRADHTPRQRPAPQSAPMTSTAAPGHSHKISDRPDSHLLG